MECSSGVAMLLDTLALTAATEKRCEDTSSGGIAGAASIPPSASSEWKSGPDLLWMTSHELRGPLNALALSSDLLVRELQSMESTPARKMAESIHRRTIWLQGLVENLLCAASIQTGHFRVLRRSVALPELGAEVQQLLEPLLEQQSQQLRLTVAGRIPQVFVDARRITQVLVNLVLNASKYSGRGTVIDVTFSKGTAGVRVTVADRGPGFGRGTTPRIFEPFYRAHEMELAGIDGNGLGLAIGRVIVEAHGGRIGARNRRSGGAVVWFELPNTQDSQERV